MNDNNKNKAIHKILITFCLTSDIKLNIFEFKKMFLSIYC